MRRELTISGFLFKVNDKKISSEEETQFWSEFLEFVDERGYVFQEEDDYYSDDEEYSDCE